MDNPKNVPKVDPLHVNCVPRITRPKKLVLSVGLYASVDENR